MVPLVSTYQRINCIRVCSFGIIRIRISNQRSIGSWCIKGTGESTLDKDPSVPLMHYDLGSIIDPDLYHSKGTHPKTSGVKVEKKEQILPLLSFP